MPIDIPLLCADDDHFPDITTAITERDGLVAIGGDLSLFRLFSAYRQGIFPWYGEHDPLCWWALSPRMVLLPENLHTPRSLAKKIRHTAYTITVNHAFAEVITQCATVPRPAQNGTWIHPEMQAAYLALHHAGFAHSFEYWQADHTGCLKLYGGLYGVQIGQVFFGESMFARVADASKITFIHAVHDLQQRGIRLIDCQMHTAHLARFGAREIPFDAFQAALKHYCDQSLDTAVIKDVLIQNITGCLKP